MKALVQFFILAICCFSNSVRCQTNPRPVCNTVCPSIVDPVCTNPERGYGYKIFDSKCELDVYNCQNPGKRYKINSDGTTYCTLPNDSCGPPLTFKNMCFHYAYNDENPDKTYGFFHNGACFTDQSPEPITDPSLDQPLEPFPEPLPEPITDPSPGPVAEPITDPSPDQSLEPFPEPITDPSPEPIADPSPEPVLDPSPEPGCCCACSQDTSLLCAIGSYDQRATLNACLLEMFNSLNPGTPYSFDYEGRCDPSDTIVASS